MSQKINTFFVRCKVPLTTILFFSFLIVGGANIRLNAQDRSRSFNEWRCPINVSELPNLVLRDYESDSIAGTAGETQFVIIARSADGLDYILHMGEDYDGSGDLRYTSVIDFNLTPQQLDNLGCRIPFWGPPDEEAIDLSTIVNERLNLDEWHRQNITGNDVRIGIIDSGFDEITDVGLPSDLLVSAPALVLDENGIEMSIDTDGVPVECEPQNTEAIIAADGSEDDTETVIPADGSAKQGSSSLCSTAINHGTNVIRILRAVAPEATLVYTRILNSATEEYPGISVEDAFESGVEALLAGEGVNLIIYAGFVITDQPERYYEAVKSATDAGVLWFNAAGNIGAGYFRDEFTGAPSASANYHQFLDPNRDPTPYNDSHETRPSLMVSMDQRRDGIVTLLWQRSFVQFSPLDGDTELVNLNDFRLSVSGTAFEGETPDFPPLRSNGRQTQFRLATNQIGNQLEEEGVEITDPLLENIFIPMFRLRALRDARAFPSEPRAELNPDRNGDTIPDGDGVADNEIFIRVDSWFQSAVPQGFDTSTFSNLSSQQRTPFTLIIQGALPAEYDPDLTYSLEPVVLVPANMDAVIAVGAAQGDHMAWYSSRTNYDQYFGDIFAEYSQVLDLNDLRYVNAIRVKPEVTTFGSIIIDGNEFDGTSASAPIVAGLAALMLDEDTGIEPAAVRDILTQRAVSCLQDGAVGKRIGRLMDNMPLPTDLANRERQECNQQAFQSSFEDVHDFRNVSTALIPEMADITLTEDKPFSENFLIITGSAQGEDMETYLLETAPIAEDGTIGEYNLLPGVIDTAPDTSTDLCTRSSERGLPQRPEGISENVLDTLNVTLVNPDTERRYFEDGFYSFRLRLCVSGRTTLIDTVRIEIRNQPDPELLLENTARISGQTITSPISFQGTAFGRGVSHYVLRAFKNGSPEPILLVPNLSETETFPAEVCTYAFSTESAEWDPYGAPVPNADLFRFDPSNFSDKGDGSYTFEVTLCGFDQIPLPLSASLTANPLQITDVTIDNFDDPFAQFSQTFVDSIRTSTIVDSPLEIRGQAGGENFTRFIVALQPVEVEGTDLPNRFIIRPSARPEEDLNALCRIPSDETSDDQSTLAKQTSSSQVLATLLPELYPVGEYLLRIYTCAENRLIPPTEGNVLTSVSIIIPENTSGLVPRVALSRVTEPLEGTRVGILGVVDVSELTHYGLEIAHLDTPDQWLPLPLTPDIEPIFAVGEEVCSVETSQNPLNLSLNEGQIAIIDTTQFVNGDYLIRLTACIEPSNQLSDEQLALLTPSPIQVRLNNPILVEFTSPSEGQILADGDLQIEGSVIFPGMDRYLIELLPLDPSQPSIPILGPSVTEDGEPIIDACSLEITSLSNGFGFSEITKGRLVEAFDTTSLNQGLYQLQIVICAEGQTYDTFQSGIFEKGIPVLLNVSNVVPFTGINGAPSFLIIEGEATAPDFLKYVVQVRDTDASDESPWISVPIGVEPIPAETVCDIDVSTAGFGTNPEVGGTLAIIPYFGLEPALYDVRVTLCRESVVMDASTVEVNPVVIQEGVLDVRLQNETLGTQTFISPINVSPVALRIGPSNAYAVNGSTLEVGSNARPIGRNEEKTWVYVQPEDGGVAGWANLGDVYFRSGQFNIENLEVVPVPALTTNISNSALNSVVFFSSNQTGRWQIYQTTLSSADPIQLTSDGDNELPSFSITRQQVVFASNRTGNQDIFLMNADGTDQVNLTINGADDYRPTWSPDGKFILFESNRNGLRNLYRLDPDTQMVTALTTGEGAPCCISLATGESSLVYASRLSGNYDIYRSSLDGAENFQLTSNPANDINPVWQPEGTTIVFQSDRTGIFQIYSMDINGLNVTQLTDGETPSIQPSWTTDGQRLIFARLDSDGYDLYTMNADGSNIQALVDEQGADVAANAGE